jgi:hypothetical protein
LEIAKRQKATKIEVKMEVQHVCDGKADWDPSKYRKMYKNLKVDVKKESAALRNEWTRE